MNITEQVDNMLASCVDDDFRVINGISNKARRRMFYISNIKEYQYMLKYLRDNKLKVYDMNVKSHHGEFQNELLRNNIDVITSIRYIDMIGHSYDIDDDAEKLGIPVYIGIVPSIIFQ